ncbi:AtzH-like domain-containing protein [Nocardioides houyundeii]|uniref:AtzH-like domain-containing protein n=1 Tax=Nocardioides houyundeii TaxID=2045452 RepID=UPI001F084AE6|nr:AtzH-like domain-containing protein [Nocardioides houyundeii]
MDAFWAYERALMANDLDALDDLFATSPGTLRGDVHGLLVGHEEISAFRGGRGGAPQRSIIETRVQAIDDDHALVVAVTQMAQGGRGLQTQLWERRNASWAVTAAHVAVPPPPLDTRIWRVVGNPLISAQREGPLTGEAVAVSDLFAVEGHRTGEAIPEGDARSRPQSPHALAIDRLLEAGADLRGITRTDGPSHGMVEGGQSFDCAPNPRAPYRVAGARESGSASAVSLGHATIGLGTETLGSLRMAASYQGLFGFRATPGAVPLDGALSTSSFFDTIGWLVRDAALMERVAAALLPTAPMVVSAPAGGSELFVVPELLALAEPEVAACVSGVASSLGCRTEHWGLDRMPTWLDAFQVLMRHEAWRRRDHLTATRAAADDPGRREQVQAVTPVSPEQVEVAERTLATARSAIRQLVGGRILVLPSTPSVAPRIGENERRVHDATLRLTCLAAIGGLPAVSIPATTSDGLPCGVGLVAASGRDGDLVTFAAGVGV